MRPSQPAPYPQETPHVHRHQTRPVAGRRKIGFAIALMLERSGDYSVLVADQDPPGSPPWPNWAVKPG